MKKTVFLLLAACAALLLPCSCRQPAPVPDEELPNPSGPETEELEPLKLSMTITGDCIFDSRPEFVIHAENPNAVAAGTEIKMTISSDLKVQQPAVLKTIEVPANGSADFPITTEAGLEPGFYTARISAYQSLLRAPVFGIRPFDIKSDPDKQADFDEYWENVKAQLPSVEGDNVTLTEIPSRSNDKAKTYLVEMQSVPDTPGGEPVLVRGYYVEPQDGQKHPVIMHFFGYDDQKPTGKMSCPSGGSEFAEFYVSTRGQMINNRTADHRSDGIDQDFQNIYGDWFAFQFGQLDGYYYRGAFMDCVQAVRFMATRESSDMGNLFGEGSSQGGAFSYAAAALSDYPFTAIAPCVAFLGDFPDYFKIVGWPGNTAKQNKGSMSDEEMYAFLSYFDTKNLATRISCAVIACSGLKDETCPPHTNIAPFNNLKTTDKEYYFYPDMGHAIPGDWTSKSMKFFRARIK